MKSLGIGLAGCGAIGKVHALAYRNLSSYYRLPVQVKLVGVCTSNERTAKRAQQEHNFEFCCNDYSFLLERDDIDIIDCCMPNYLHKNVILDTISCGKHIYCEKPLAMNVEEAEQIINAVRNSNVKHQIAFNYRFVPATIRAKQLIKQDSLGKIFSFRGEYLHSGYIDLDRPMSWRLRKEEAGGGALIDLGIHIIDLIRYLLGDFKSVLAVNETVIKSRRSENSGERENVSVDDISILLLRLENGGVGSVEASRLATGANDDLRIKIHGSKGAIFFSLMEPNWLYFYDATEKGEPIGGDRGFKRIETVQRYPDPNIFPYSKSTVGWVRFHIAGQYEFIRAITENLPTEPSFEDGLAAQRVVEAAYLSSYEKKWMNIK
ncbi:Gfo/Idh/MocA family oxidoreductase [Candidatus Aerophobetes bacterium]|nr:Gfo/Idh/MocA family oxidoreductase [Candidatus Aerophobetes bacterium]